MEINVKPVLDEWKFGFPRHVYERLLERYGMDHDTTHRTILGITYAIKRRKRDPFAMTVSENGKKCYFYHFHVNGISSRVIYHNKSQRILTIYPEDESKLYDSVVVVDYRYAKFSPFIN